MGCNTPESWKKECFSELIEAIYGDELWRKKVTSRGGGKNKMAIVDSDAGYDIDVISVGDAIHDREALFGALVNTKQVASKTVKFLVNPSFQELIEQHRVLADNLLDLISHSGDGHWNMA